LEEAEARSLRDLLGASIGDMSMEIADTDNPTFRKELKSRRDRLQRVLEAIDTAIPHDLVGPEVSTTSS
jgi:hypothetical protein